MLAHTQSQYIHIFNTCQIKPYAFAVRSVKTTNMQIKEDQWEHIVSNDEVLISFVLTELDPVFD